MSTTTLPVPPIFDPMKWPLTDNKVVHTFAGVIPNFSDINRFLMVDEENSTVTIIGKTARALNLQLETQDPEGNFPIYLEVGGRRYHYVISIWQDRFDIKVWDHETLNTTTSQVAHRPNFSSISTLESVLRDISNDLP